MNSHRIVYPRGDRTVLTVVVILDYEEDEYALASRERFDHTVEGEALAWDRCRSLSEENGLTVVGDPMPRHDYLD